MQTVIFDLDGTLADTSGDLIAAANACFVDLGWGGLLDPVRDAGTALRGGRAMLTLGFERNGAEGQAAAADMDAHYQKLLAHYGTNIDTHTTLYPHAMEAIGNLKAEGYRVGICTNKPEGLARLLLTRLGVLKEFHSLIGADTLPTRKPDTAPYVAAVEQAGGSVERSLLVGDTMTDRQTSLNAGVPSVLVTFGPGAEDVKAMDPEALLSDYRHLRSVVSSLIG